MMVSVTVCVLPHIVKQWNILQRLFQASFVSGSVAIFEDNGLTIVFLLFLQKMYFSKRFHLKSQIGEEKIIKYVDLIWSLKLY